MPADVKKAYTVAVVFVVIGLAWSFMGRGDTGSPPIIAAGITMAGALGIIAAAFLSIRAKRRQSSQVE